MSASSSKSSSHSAAIFLHRATTVLYEGDPWVYAAARSPTSRLLVLHLRYTFCRTLNFQVKCLDAYAYAVAVAVERSRAERASRPAVSLPTNAALLGSIALNSSAGQSCAQGMRKGRREPR